MEENVALDSSKQKQFVKSIKGIKKLLKGKGKAKSKEEKTNHVKIGKIKKPSRRKRGLVYLSHIPHGFYEHQMTEYFKQFGVVTNARVIRSKRTGMSKGHAFVEFKDPNVAQVVAETMNNYLMGKRLIKAAVVPPEKQRKFAKRKHWNAQNNPANDLRQKMKKTHNSVKDEKEDLQIARKLLSNLNRTKKRLRELDIDYDFFTPVDIPEALLNLVETKKEEDVKTSDVIKKEKKLKNDVKEEKDVKKKNKGKEDIEVKDKEATQPAQADSSVSKKVKKSKENAQSADKMNLGEVSKDNIKNKVAPKAEKEVGKEKKSKEVSKKVETNSKMSKGQQKKEEKLKQLGVKQPANFIPLQNDSDNETDSSVNFDSDEYDKVMEQSDSEVESDSESDEDLDEDITSEDDASEVNEPSLPILTEKSSKTKTQAGKNKQTKKPVVTKPPPQTMTRMSQRGSKPPKKPKFEKKGNKKAINKVIKKKK